MRKIQILLILLLTGRLVCAGQANSAVFAEVFGNGVGLSVNFDSRFSKNGKGLGYRGGIGFYPGTVFNSAFLAFPLGLNHLAGKAPHYFETGIGITIIPGVQVFWYDQLRASNGLLIPSVGYRFAGKKRGFQGRVFISPWIGQEGAIFMGGLSGGIGF